MVGMLKQDTPAIMSALLFYSRYFCPNAMYTLQNLEEIHADAGSQFLSSEFLALLQQFNCPTIV